MPRKRKNRKGLRKPNYPPPPPPGGKRRRRPKRKGRKTKNNAAKPMHSNMLLTLGKNIAGAAMPWARPIIEAGVDFLSTLSTPGGPNSTIFGSTGDEVVNFTIAPRALSNTRLNKMSELYQRFLFTKVVIKYMPSINVTQSGQLIGYFDTDPHDSPPTGVDGINFANSHGGVLFQISEPTSFSMPIIRDRTYYTSFDDSTEDERFKIQAVFRVLQVTTLPAAAAIGSFSVEYMCQLELPQMAQTNTSPTVITYAYQAGLSFATLTGTARLFAQAFGALNKFFPETTSLSFIDPLTGNSGAPISRGNYVFNSSILTSQTPLFPSTTTLTSWFSLINTNHTITVFTPNSVANSTNVFVSVSFIITGGTDSDLSSFNPLVAYTAGTSGILTFILLKETVVDVRKRQNHSIANRFDLIEERLNRLSKERPGTAGEKNTDASLFGDASGPSPSAIQKRGKTEDDFQVVPGCDVPQRGVRQAAQVVPENSVRQNFRVAHAEAPYPRPLRGALNFPHLLAGQGTNVDDPYPD